MENPYISVLAGNDTILLAETRGGGLLRSTEGGHNWVSVNSGLPSEPVTVMLFRGSGIFAGTNGSGLFYSADHGDTWVSCNNGLPAAAKITTLSPGDTRILAGMDDGELFTSDNNGNFWSPLPQNLTTSPAVGGVFCEPNLFEAFSGTGIFLLKAGTNEWVPENLGLSDSTISVFTQNNLNLFAGIAGSGVWKRPYTDIFSMAVIPDTLVMKQQQGYADTLIIQSDVSWSIEGQTVSWLFLDKTKGRGSDHVVISTLSANAGNSARFATFLLTSGKAATVPFIIEQLGKTDGVPDGMNGFFSVYPNPTQGPLLIRSSLVANGMALFNSAGRMIRQEQGELHEIAMDISGEPDGIYYLRIAGEGWSHVLKVVLIK